MVIEGSEPDGSVVSAGAVVTTVGAYRSAKGVSSAIFATPKILNAEGILTGISRRKATSAHNA